MVYVRCRVWTLDNDITDVLWGKTDDNVLLLLTLSKGWLSRHQSRRCVSCCHLWRVLESVSRLSSGVSRVPLRTEQVLLRLPSGDGQHNGEEHIRPPDQQTGDFRPSRWRNEPPESALEETSRYFDEIRGDIFKHKSYKRVWGSGIITIQMSIRWVFLYSKYTVFVNRQVVNCFKVESYVALLPSWFNWYLDQDWEISLGWDLNRGPPDFQPWLNNLCAIKTSFVCHMLISFRPPHYYPMPSPFSDQA